MEVPYFFMLGLRVIWMLLVTDLLSAIFVLYFLHYQMFIRENF